jgi:Putative beta-barrel porin 2
MFRSGTLTLGAVLMLGGASGVQGQDLSAFGAVAAPSFVGVLPNLPQNWSDLPLQLKVSEAVGYNSNLLNTPSEASALVGAQAIGLRPVAAFESISDYGASTKWYIAGDQFFADGSLGWNRYLNHTDFNTQHDSADIGVNWIYGSKCTGQLVASEQTAESLPGQQVSVNAINSLTTVAFKETANCAVTGNYAAIFNSGTTNSTNSAPLDQLNNFQSKFVAAGINYTVSDTNSLQLLATITGFDYANRTVSTQNVGGLLSKFTEDQVNLSYNKQFDPNLSVVASIGVVGIKDTGFTLAVPNGFVPDYSLSVTWSATPKLSLVASLGHTVAPPTNIVANLQVSDDARLGVTYQFTPKVTLGAGVNVGYGTTSFTSTTVNPLAQSQNERLYGAQATVTYAMTPFLEASLSYQFSKTVQAGLMTPTGVSLLTVKYAPY